LRFSKPVRGRETAGTGETLAVDILIAEDEPSILESLDFILQRAGWKIESVTDGESVIERVRRFSPRVVVLDVMLPRRSGFDVLRQLRAQADTREVKILILTAKGQPQDRRIAEELGADDFVTKPYSNADVVDAVRRLMG
jgi:two-component system, OmpR family, response regulator